MHLQINYLLFTIYYLLLTQHKPNPKRIYVSDNTYAREVHYIYFTDDYKLSSKDNVGHYNDHSRVFHNIPLGLLLYNFEKSNVSILRIHHQPR